jgi:hypothetical protein
MGVVLSGTAAYILPRQERLPFGDQGDLKRLLGTFPVHAVCTAAVLANSGAFAKGLGG